MIKTIIFDLNKVLVTFEDIDNREDYEHILGVKYEDFWKVGREKFMAYNLGQTSLDEYLSSILETLNIDKNLLEETKKLYAGNLSVVKGMREILEALQKRYRLVVLAGDGKDSVNLKIDNFNLRQFFSKIYSSWSEKMHKEEVKLYEKVLTEENINPKEALFIDDIEAHINIANKLGINTILFKDAEQLKQDLAKFSILLD